LAPEDGDRLWFVVDQDRLFERYGPLFTQQVFAQMDIASHTGRVLVFRSQPYPRSMAADPAVRIDANFSGKIELAGYDVDWGAIAPDGTAQLVLYWQPLSASFEKPFKVFVQLRNEAGENVAQADHFILEGMLNNQILTQLGEENEWLRDTAELSIPVGLPSGTYRLVVGMYDPDTFERLPLIADESGENAVELERITVP